MAEITTEVNAIDNKDVINDYEKKLSKANQELKELKEFQQLALDVEKSNRSKKEQELTANNEFKSLYEQLKAESDKVKAEYEKTLPKFKELSEFKKSYDEQQEKLKLTKIDEIVLKYSYDEVKKTKLLAMNNEQFEVFLSLLPDVKTPANSLDAMQKNTMTNIDTTKMSQDELMAHKLTSIFPEIYKS